MRSYLLNKTVIKIEDKCGRLYMVLAVPVSKSDGTCVVELIKDITDSGIIDLAGLDTEMIRRMIKNRNNSVILDALTKLYNESFIFERLPYDISKSGFTLFRIKLEDLDSINMIFLLRWG